MGDWDIIHLRLNKRPTIGIVLRVGQELVIVSKQDVS